MTEHYDALETRSADEREASLLAALPARIAQAKAQSPAMAEHLAGVDAAAVTSRAALARVPVLRKASLFDRQKAHRESTTAWDPFGGFSTIGWGAMQAAGRGARRVFQSPGPIYEPEGTAPDYWRVARAMHAAGFRAGDLVHSSFSYHLTPAGSMFETGAAAIGCTIFAGGTGNTELQLQAIADLRPNAYAGTPSFLRILFEKADEAKLPKPTMTKALCGGEAFPPSLVAAMRERGVEGFQCYATADAGLIAYETRAREGLVIDEGVLVEIVRPGTSDPVPDGEVGEVVVTVFNPDYPLIRFGTGDLSAVLPGPCPTGRTNLRLEGWMGRADQTAKVRGMFVHPSQVAEIVKRHPEIQRARLVVSGEQARDEMTLRVEAPVTQGLAERVAGTVRDVTKLRADIDVVAPGSLPNDGKVIEDARSYR